MPLNSKNNPINFLFVVFFCCLFRCFDESKRREKRNVTLSNDSCVWLEQIGFEACERLNVCHIWPWAVAVATAAATEELMECFESDVAFFLCLFVCLFISADFSFSYFRSNKDEREKKNNGTNANDKYKLTASSHQNPLNTSKHGITFILHNKLQNNVDVEENTAEK